MNTYFLIQSLLHYNCEYYLTTPSLPQRIPGPGRPAGGYGGALQDPAAHLPERRRPLPLRADQRVPRLLRLLARRCQRLRQPVTVPNLRPREVLRPAGHQGVGAATLRRFDQLWLTVELRRCV